MARVIYPFADLLDDNYIYQVGDEFPRPGVIVGAERYAELEGSNNKIGRPLIATDSRQKPSKEVKTDKESTDNVKAERKASTAKKPAKKK